jgi:hypothetical protein
MVKVGDTVEITPIEKLPNLDRKFKVNSITNDSFIYGVSETCDGYEMPFEWFTEIKIVK